MKWWVNKYLLLGVSVFVLLSVIAHFLVDSQLSWKVYNLSDLAAQNTPYNWVMQAAFVALGIILFSGTVVKLLLNKGIYLVEASILIFSIAIAMSGLFSTVSSLDFIGDSQVESEVHQICQLIAQGTILLGIFLNGLLMKDQQNRIVQLLFFFVALLVQMDGLYPHVLGVVMDKAFYLLISIWLLFGFDPKQKIAISVKS